MTNKNYKLNQEVQNLLIDGGTFVKVLKEGADMDYLFTGLIRMPKGKWLPDKREEYIGNKFEYAIVQSHAYTIEGVKTIYPVAIMSSHNEHIVTMKGKAIKAHSEDMQEYYRRKWRAEDAAKKAIA